MLKKIALFLLLPVLGYSQSLELSAQQGGGQDSYSTFRLQDGEVFISGNTIRFVNSGIDFGDYLGYGVAPGYDLIAVLKNSSDGPQAYILNTSGDTLSVFDTVSLSYDDPSLAVYPLGTGSALIQNNIANFTFYNSAGTITSGGSGSSGSEDGETIAEVAMDSNGKTVLIYTPRIRASGEIGSQALILKDGNTLENIFLSGDREIVDGGVSENGQFIYLVTAALGSGREVLIMDRYGNRLNSFSVDDELIGASFSGDASYITVYSSRRALVYSTVGGESQGSTSFRSPLIRARYFPEDQTIVGLTGSEVQGTDILEDLEFHAINLGQRQIARQTLSGAIGTSPDIDLRFEREAPGRYRLTGGSRAVTLQASF